MPKPRNSLESEFERLEFLRSSGVDPWQDVFARQMERPGFELPDRIRQNLSFQALLNRERQRHCQLPPVPRDRAIYVGDRTDGGGPAFLDANEMGHILLAGATKVGKNNGAALMMRGFLALGKRGEVIAQKGDEVGMASLFPGAIYLPAEMEPCNDWDPIGPDHFGFWTANAESLAIPKSLKDQTYPELAIIAQQMWRSRPHFSWMALIECLRWKARQPGGREKFDTAAGALATYASLIGDRAYVEKGTEVSECPLIVRGYLGYDLLQQEVAFGLRFVRERYAAIQRGHSRSPERAIFVPEAQLLYSREVEANRRGNISYLSRFLTMTNSFNISLWLALQNVSRASAYAANNTQTFFAYRQENLTDARWCVERLGLPEDAVQDILSLSPGEAWCRTPGWDRGLKIRQPLVVPNQTPPEPLVRQQFQAVYEQLRRNATYTPRNDIFEILDWEQVLRPSPTKHQQSASAKHDPKLLADHLALLRDIRDNPQDGIATRIRRQGFGMQKGLRIATDLQTRGLITITSVKSNSPKGGRSKSVYSVTPVGLAFLNASRT